MWDRSLYADRQEKTFENTGNVLKPDCGDVCPTVNLLKKKINEFNYTFTMWRIFFVCKLYFNKLVAFF